MKKTVLACTLVGLLLSTGASAKPKLVSLKVAIKQALGDNIIYTESIPRLQVAPLAKAEDPAHTIDELSNRYGLQFTATTNGYIVSRDSLEPVAKGEFRFFKTDDQYTLIVNGTNANRVVSAIQKMKGAPKFTFDGLETLTLGELNVSSSSVVSLLKAVKAIEVSEEGEKKALVLKKSNDADSADWPLVFYSGSDFSHDTKPLLDFFGKVYKEEELKVAVFRNTLHLSGKSAAVKQAQLLLATVLDIPRPQVRLGIWTLQVNQRIDRYGDVAETMRIIDEGAQLTRNLLREFDWLTTISIRELAKQPKQINFLPEEIFLYRHAGINVNPERTLSPSDITTFLCYADQATLRGWFTNLRAIWLSRLNQLKVSFTPDTPGLTRAERRRRQNLIKLLDIQIGQAQSAEFFARTSLAFGGYKVEAEVPQKGHWLSAQAANRQQFKDFLQAYWACTAPKKETDLVFQAKSKSYPSGLASQQPPTEPPVVNMTVQQSVKNYEDTYSKKDAKPELPSPRDLAKLSVGTDTLLREAAEVYHDDLRNQFFEPYRQWTQEIASENNELSVLGYVSVASTSETEAKSSVSAQNFHPFHLRVNAKGEAEPNEAAQVAFSEDPLLEAAKILSKPEAPPVFVSVAPGISLNVSSQVQPGSSSARLRLTLENSTKAAVDDKLVERGLAPVAFVDKSTLTTDVVISASDLFELGTQGVQTTRIGEPDWAIPILRDIPLIGKYVFQGPPVPRTRQQNVLMLVDAWIVPRSMDLIWK